MSVSLNTSTNIAWFYGGRAESSNPPNYVRHTKKCKCEILMNSSTTHFIILILMKILGIGQLLFIRVDIDLQDMVILALLCKYLIYLILLVIDFFFFF